MTKSQLEELATFMAQGKCANYFSLKKIPDLKEAATYMINSYAKLLENNEDVYNEVVPTTPENYMKFKINFVLKTAKSL